MYLLDHENGNLILHSEIYPGMLMIMLLCLKSNLKVPLVFLASLNLARSMTDAGEQLLSLSIERNKLSIVEL
jgi:hypothetical protein